MNRFMRGSALARESLNILRNDKVLVMFPLASTGICFVISIVFSILAFILGLMPGVNAAETGRNTSNASGGQVVLGLIALFVYYVVIYTVVTISNASLIAMVRAKMKGEAISVTTGSSRPRSRA